jgi:AcrR family transcriptional regulator
MSRTIKGLSLGQNAKSGSPFRTATERVQDRANKRDAVLLAAVRMFNERGFHATSLDDVAASLGVTKPMIYHYLGTKDQVLFECVRNGLQQLRNAAAEAASRPGTGLVRLQQFLCSYAECIMNDFGRCVARTNDEMLTPESRRQFRKLKSDIDQVLRHMIEAAAADGSAEVDDIKFTAFAFAGALNWTAQWHQPDGPLKAEEIAAKLADILIGGITPARTA